MKTINQKVIYMSSSRYGVKNTNKEFRMTDRPQDNPVPKSHIMINFLDHEGKPIMRINEDGKEVIRQRLCSYNVGDINKFIEELKLVYQEVRFLDKEKGVDQVTVRLESGETVDESFDKFRKPKDSKWSR